MVNSYEKDKDSDNASVESKAKGVIDFEIVLEYIGAGGKYQLLLVLIAYYVCIPCGMHQVAAVFLAAIPEYRCYIPGVDDWDNISCVTENQLANFTRPWLDDKQEYDSCNRYNCSFTSCDQLYADCLAKNPEPGIIPCDAGYHYDTSVYSSTVTTEWDLVCNRLLTGTSVTAFYYCGVLISAVVGGSIADLFGRGPTMLVGQMGLMAVGIGCAFSPSLIAFACLRFTLALFLMASYVAAFVYVMEITAGKWRTIVGINIQAAFAVGYMILSGLAYNWRDWRSLQIVISLVSLPFALMWIFLPESPRWLFSKGKIEKAKKISHTIAKRNGRELPDDIWTKATSQDLVEDSRRYSPIELFRRPLMRILTLNIMFNWFVISLVYYGLSLNVGALAGDDFVNNTLSGVVELISFPIVILTIDRFGRRIILCCSLVIGGLSCLGSTAANMFADDIPELGTVGTVLALLGKMAISGAFAIIYNYTAELYPTVARSTAVGLGSMAARVGSVLTPYTLFLQYTIPWLTGTIFGVLSLIASVSCLAFPETMGKTMLTTFEDAEEFFAQSRSSLKSDISSISIEEVFDGSEKSNIKAMTLL